MDGSNENLIKNFSRKLEGSVDGSNENLIKNFSRKLEGMRHLRITFKQLGFFCVFYVTNKMQLMQCSLLLSALYMFHSFFPPIIRRF